MGPPARTTRSRGKSSEVPIAAQSLACTKRRTKSKARAKASVPVSEPDKVAPIPTVEVVDNGDSDSDKEPLDIPVNTKRKKKLKQKSVPQKEEHGSPSKGIEECDTSSDGYRISTIFT